MTMMMLYGMSFGTSPDIGQSTFQNAAPPLTGGDIYIYHVH